MTKNVLCTGAAGFIGSHLVDGLLKKGWFVDGVDDLSNGHLEFLNHLINFTAKENRKINLAIDDFSSDDIIKKIKSGKYDYIFHLAAIPRVSYSVEYPYKTSNNNIDKTIKLMEAARGNVKRIIFSSSSSVYGGAETIPTPESEPKNPVSPYAMQKSVIEDFGKLFCHLYDIDFVSLRYFNVVGPRCYGDSPYATAVSAWLHAIKHNLPLRSDWTGEQFRDLCPVPNVVHANILAAEYHEKLNGECFNVACGETATNNEILNFFKKRFGDLNIVEAPKRPGDVFGTCADIKKIKNYLGYRVQAYFWDYLEEIIDWWEV